MFGYSRRSKRYRSSVRGKTFHLVNDFAGKQRYWWEGSEFKIPDAKLFLDIEGIRRNRQFNSCPRNCPSVVRRRPLFILPSGQGRSSPSRSGAFHRARYACDFGCHSESAERLTRSRPHKGRVLSTNDKLTCHTSNSSKRSL